MKTERVVLLTTPAFKAFLAREAHKEGISVAELVRNRCQRASAPADGELAVLLPELRRSLALAQTSLNGGLAEAASTLQALRAARVSASPTVAA